MQAEDRYKIVYDSIIKRHQSTNVIHSKRLAFYVFDVIILLVNVGLHFSNGSYTAICLTIVIHSASGAVIGTIYNANEHEIDMENITLQANREKWATLRAVAKYLGFTPLFRIILNWKDHGALYSQIRLNQKLRNDVEICEVEVAVRLHKRLLVNAYFDTILAYFKAIPQCLLQIFVALNLNVPLRFCVITDVTRFFTMVTSMFMAARASAYYTSELSDYLKLMQIQDYLQYERNIDSLRPPVSHLWWTSLLVNGIVIFSRVYTISFILFYSKLVFLPLCLVLFVFILYSFWIRINPESRPIYENPPVGVPTIYSETIDRFMNVFSVHTMKPSITTVIIHQVVYGCALFAFLTGIQLTLLNHSSNSTVILSASNIYQNSSCNFSIFSDSKNNFAQAIHSITNILIGNVYGNKTSMFFEIFTMPFLHTLLGLSLAAAISYVLYLKYFKLKEQRFPMNISVQYWTRFLNVDWNDYGQVTAMKTLLLGTLDSNILEHCNFRFDENIKSLKQLIGIVNNVHNIRFQHTISRYSNPCHQLIETLKNYLNLSHSEGTEELCDYFLNNFHLCMDDVTSYRIAQTSIALNCDKRKNGLFSNIFFLNFKHFGFRFGNGFNR